MTDILTVSQREQAEKILNGLERQKFEDWYNTEFRDYIEDNNCYSQKTREIRETLLTDIVQLFGLRSV